MSLRHAIVLSAYYGYRCMRLATSLTGAPPLATARLGDMPSPLRTDPSTVYTGEYTYRLGWPSGGLSLFPVLTQSSVRQPTIN